MGSADYPVVRFDRSSNTVLLDALYELGRRKWPLFEASFCREVAVILYVILRSLLRNIARRIFVILRAMPA